MLLRVLCSAFTTHVAVISWLCSSGCSLNAYGWQGRKLGVALSEGRNEEFGVFFGTLEGMMEYFFLDTLFFTFLVL